MTEPTPLPMEIIAAVVVYVGGFVISSIIARSAYFAGLPLYKGIVIGIVVVFLLTLSINMLSLVFARHRKTAIEPWAKKQIFTKPPRAINVTDKP